jgi:prepilin-type N-terminal cleavage/methylation domain-containing protein
VRRGFTLLELMVALALLTVFAGLAYWVTRTALRAYYEVPVAEREEMDGRAMLERLREDVFSARAVTLLPGAKLVVMNGSEQVWWTVRPEGIVVRLKADSGMQKGAEFEVFDHAAPGGIFRVEGSVVRFESKRGSFVARGETMRLLGRKERE